SALLLATLLPLLTSATPLLPRQTTTPAPEFTLHVGSFSAFMADPYVDGAQSNLTFHVSDTRPGLEAEVDCVIPPTFFNLYAISALFDFCGDRSLDVTYRYGETGLTVRRGWRVNETTYLTGSSTQNTNWIEQGPGANVTVYPDGKMFARKSEWLFPVTRVQ
ncbi:hypothetical protein K505DRAFT_216909, partial [Melanomma pulvis-pyrius CBS 109.77]